jgi:hypothetical protein
VKWRLNSSSKAAMNFIYTPTGGPRWEYKLPENGMIFSIFAKQ